MHAEEFLQTPGPAVLQAVVDPLEPLPAAHLFHNI